jgi:formate hydrogenlyase subunit 6/NADH:ubiquinone oxidoreductase subunit I
MLYILDKITKGSGTQEDLSRLERLAKAVALGSLCGLGSTAPNPVLTAIRHFRPEFMEHIIDRSCKALSCSALISFSIDKERCIGCDSCVQACPAGAITGEKKSVHTIDPDKCIRCGACAEACPSKSGAVIRQRRAQA